MPIVQPEIVEMNLADIDINPDNPRVITPRAYHGLTESLTRFGDLGLYVWNKRTSRLLSGNQRVSILKAAGVEKARFIVVDVDQTEELAIMIEMNNILIGGDWTQEKLVDQLKEIEVKDPSTFDALRMADLRRSVMEKETGKGSLVDPRPEIPEMEIQPYEHWDYIALFFKDSRDFMQALEHFGIKKVKMTLADGKRLIGLGRVIDGAAYMERINQGKGPKK